MQAKYALKECFAQLGKALFLFLFWAKNRVIEMLDITRNEDNCKRLHGIRYNTLWSIPLIPKDSKFKVRQKPSEKPFAIINMGSKKERGFIYKDKNAKIKKGSHLRRLFKRYRLSLW